MRLPLDYNEGPIVTIVVPCKEMVFSVAKKIRKIVEKVREVKGFPEVKIVECVGGESTK